MTLIDLITLISLLYAVFGVGLGVILAWRSPSRYRALPRFLALGGGVAMFVSLMTASVLLHSRSAFATYIVQDSLIAIAFAVLMYFSGAKLAQMIWKR